jgi:hypothetical protein
MGRGLRNWLTLLAGLLLLSLIISSFAPRYHFLHGNRRHQCYVNPDGTRTDPKHVDPHCPNYEGTSTTTLEGR